VWENEAVCNTLTEPSYGILRLLIACKTLAIFKNMNSTTKTINDVEHRSLRLGMSDSVKNYKPQQLTTTNIFFQSGEANSVQVLSAEMVDDNATTHFIDKGNNVSVMKPAMKTIPISVSSTMQNINQDIKQFLARPIVYLDSTIAQGVISVLSRTDITSFVFNTANGIWFNKTNGIYGMRFTTVFTMRVNGSRFDSGLISMAFHPTHGSVSATNLTNMRANSRIQLTQMSHVDLDINCDSSATLKIPWVSSKPFLVNEPPASRNGTPGDLVVYTYGAYRSVTPAQTLRYTVYVHLEDVEFFGNAIFQAGGKTVVRRKDIKTEEEQSDRPISSTLRTISDVTGKLGFIPMLSDFLTPVSWVTDAMSKCAYIFGYSNPRVVQPPSRMTSLPLPHLTCFDEHSNAVSLGISVSNKVDGSVITFGTEQDETSLDFLKSIFSFYTSFQLTNAQSDETKIYSVPLCPRSFQVTTSLTASTRVIPTPLSFLSHLHVCWRGSIKMRFILVKTEFHRCRLGFSYNPTTDPVNWDATDPILREIVDIREGRIIELTIPYVNSYNWLESTANIGYLSVWKLDDLRSSNDSTPTDIDILVEVAGGEDFQFSMRRNFALSVGTLATFQSGDNTCEIVNTNIGSATIPSMDMAHFATCIGEPFLTLTQTLKAGSFGGTAAPSARFAGYAHAIAINTNVDPIATDATLINDLFSIVASAYGGMKGGIRLAFMLPNDQKFVLTTRSSNTVQRLLTGSTTLTLKGTHDVTFNTSLAFTSQADGTMIVDFPYYGTLPSVSTWECMTNNAGTAQSSGVGAPYSVFNLFNGISAIAEEISIYRGVAEDFQLGNFAAFPIIYIL
jgi:hypothetical protein